MDGIADMGGMQGFGRVAYDPEGALFREEWERRAFGLTSLSIRLAQANVDAFRHAVESLHPLDYLGDGYYGRWLRGAEQLLVTAGVIAPGAVEARARRLTGEDAAEPPEPTPRQPPYRPAGPGSLRQVDRPPRFRVGQTVRARDLHPAGHTRLPRYVRGRTGVVARLQPAAVLPDTNAHYAGENPEHVYGVEFDAAELWGGEPSAGERFTLHVDLFESYLEALP